MALTEVNEQAEAWYTATVKDQDGTAMTAANVASLTLSIFEKVGEAIVNLRDQTDLRNAGAWDQGCTISEAGLLTLRLLPDDNEIINQDNIDLGRSEIHVLLFEGTTAGSPSYAFKHRYEYKIRNLEKVELAGE
jgi:hypothetical protein